MNFSDLIYDSAEDFDLDPKLVASIIYQESGGDPDAYRFEDKWYEKNMAWRKRKDLAGFVPYLIPTLDSEKRARSASWGLMQVLGETGRVIGFKGRWLPTIAKPEINVPLGCKYLRLLFDRAAFRKEPNVLFWVLKQWNGSGEYPPLIIQHMKEEKWRKIIQET